MPEIRVNAIREPIGICSAYNWQILCVLGLNVMQSVVLQRFTVSAVGKSCGFWIVLICIYCVASHMLFRCLGLLQALVTLRIACDSQHNGGTK